MLNISAAYCPTFVNAHEEVILLMMKQPEIKANHQHIDQLFL